MTQPYDVGKRSVRILTALLLFGLLFCSCANEDLIDVLATSDDSGNVFIWAPRVEIKKGDNQATLLLTDPRPFTADTKQASTLFEVDYHNYNFLNPGFTPDGNKLSFLSSEGNSEKHHYDFWTLDPVSKSRARISNFEEVGFLPNGTYDWSPSGEDIYLTARYDGEYDTDIYKYNLSTKVVTPVIVSSWYDSSPSVSPDNHKIAFISNRTGQDELWVYDLVTLKYSQITGRHYQFDSRYTNLEWLSSEQMLISLYEGEISFAVVVNVN